MANRGAVQYTEPGSVTAKTDNVSASFTRYLLTVLLTMMNERDSINKILANPATFGDGARADYNNGNTAGSGYAVKQLDGIVDKAKESEMVNAQNNIFKGQYVYAKDVNSIIKYTNELLTTVGSSNYSYQAIPCQYPLTNVTIIKHNDQAVVPDQALVDPITGVEVLDANGNKIMVPGYYNPVPVYDSQGNPTYYTVTGKQIYQEGPVVNADQTEVATLCGNTGITCPNRVARWGWSRADSADSVKMVNICSNTNRSQMVYNQSSAGGNAVTSVNVDEFITASTFNLISANLRLISTALDSYKDWWQNGGCNRSCQVSCQKSCQVSCQNCYGGTCHDQNCGGWS